jgi:hypothetical protein
MLRDDQQEMEPSTNSDCPDSTPLACKAVGYSYINQLAQANLPINLKSVYNSF